MAEVILMSRKAEHQHVCSTYHSRTKPNAQANTAIRAANVATFNSPSGGFNFQQTVYKSPEIGLCYAQATKPTHHPN